MKLEEAVIILIKSKIKAGDGKKEGKYPLYRSSNKIDTYYDGYLLDEEVIIVGTGGNPSIHYNKGKCAYTTQCLVLKSKGEFENKYIDYYLLSRLNKIKRMFRGLAIKQLDKKAFFKLDILLVDKVKQKRIIENLDNITRNIQSKKGQLKKLEELVKSQFVEMFGDIKNSKFDINSIKKLVDINIMKTKKKHKKRDIIKYVDISSINNLKNEIISYKEYEVGLEPSRAQQCLEKGDILISTVRPNLKNIAVNNYEEDNIVGSSGFCVLRVNKCIKEYLFEVVKTEKFTNDMILLATGANYPAIRDKDILDYKIAVPPITLQNQFSEIVKQIDKQKFEIEKSLKETQELYESLMKEYFKGDRE